MTQLEMIVLRTLMKETYNLDTLKHLKSLFNDTTRDDCLEDADERNLQFITGKPVWCKTREDEYIFALDDAVINEINIVLDEELLSPEVTSLDTINHIILKITEVMKNSGLSTGLFRDNTRRKI